MVVVFEQNKFWKSHVLCKNSIVTFILKKHRPTLICTKIRKKSAAHIILTLIMIKHFEMLSHNIYFNFFSLRKAL